MHRRLLAFKNVRGKEVELEILECYAHEGGNYAGHERKRPTRPSRACLHSKKNGNAAHSRQLTRFGTELRIVSQKTKKTRFIKNGFKYFPVSDIFTLMLRRNS